MHTKSQTALITGASGGIGYELAKLFARDHYNLVLVARSPEKLTQVATELNRFGVTVRTIPVDLAASPAPKFLFDQLQRENIVVDVLINNAGFGPSASSPPRPKKRYWARFSSTSLHSRISPGCFSRLCSRAGKARS